MTAIVQRRAPARIRSFGLGQRALRRGLQSLLLLALLAAALGLGAVVAPRALGYGTLAVMSGSMGRAAPTGSLVIGSWHAPEEIAVGDVILVRRRNRAPVLHRVTARERSGDETVVRLKGDANAAPDPEMFALPHRVLRKDHALPLIGYLVAFLRIPLGWFVIVGIPATLVAVSVLREVWRRPEDAPVVALPEQDDAADLLTERAAELERRAFLLVADEARARDREREIAAREAAHREAIGALTAALEQLAAERDRLAASSAALERRAEAVLAAEAAVAPAAVPEEPSWHLELLPRAEGYVLIECPGSVPQVGTMLADAVGGEYVVTRVTPSPLPEDDRRCAYLQRR